MKPFVNQQKIKEEMKKLQKIKQKAVAKKLDLRNRAAASQRLRQKKRQREKRYAADHPEDKTVIIEESPGRPSIECPYPHFS